MVNCWYGTSKHVFTSKCQNWKLYNKISQFNQSLQNQIIGDKPAYCNQLFYFDNIETNSMIVTP